jgi:hypothetical protein
MRPFRKALIPGVENIQRQSLADPKKVLPLPLHLKLGLVKQFVKCENIKKNGKYFKYTREKFPGLCNAKLKKIVSVGPSIRKLIKDETFVLEWKWRKIMTGNHLN